MFEESSRDCSGDDSGDDSRDSSDDRSEDSFGDGSEEVSSGASDKPESEVLSTFERISKSDDELSTSDEPFVRFRLLIKFKMVDALIDGSSVSWIEEASPESNVFCKMEGNSSDDKPAFEALSVLSSRFRLTLVSRTASLRCRLRLVELPFFTV